MPNDEPTGPAPGHADGHARDHPNGPSGHARSQDAGARTDPDDGSGRSAVDAAAITPGGTHAGATSLGAAARVRTVMKDPQHRDTTLLTLNSVLGAAGGLLFWLVAAKWAGLPPATIGVGMSIISLGTIVAILAKGGLDVSIIRNVPRASSREGKRLLRWALATSLIAVGVLTFLFMTGGRFASFVPRFDLVAWGLVAACGALLAITWLQDAHFLAEGRVQYSVQRNVVFNGARLLLPVPLVAVTLMQPVALAWVLALLTSALVAGVALLNGPQRAGGTVQTREVLRGSVLDISGNAAEVMPSLMLTPMVLAFAGATVAGTFGIAWAGASIFLMAAVAVGRSAMATLVRDGGVVGAAERQKAIRRGAVQVAIMLIPGVIVASVMAPYVLAILGPEYASGSTWFFRVLAWSMLLVAPSMLYLALLRVGPYPLKRFTYPAALVFVVITVTALFGARWGADGVLLGWVIGNAPFSLYALHQLWQESGSPAERPAHATPTPLARGDMRPRAAGHALRGERDAAPQAAAAPRHLATNADRGERL